MSRYIDADEFAKKIDRASWLAERKGDPSLIYAFSEVVTPLLASAPTADVEEAKHGQWLVDGDEHLGIGFICSSCGKERTDTTGFLYCPNCGAKMDL